MVDFQKKSLGFLSMEKDGIPSPVILDVLSPDLNHVNTLPEISDRPDDDIQECMPLGFDLSLKSDGFSAALPRLKAWWNQLNFPGDVEGSQSMIISCSCLWRTNYPLEISGPQEVLKSCKICGSSRRLVKDCLPLPLNMVGTIGREHSRALARNITWVISTKNNLRAPRRRKAFPLANRKDITESAWQVSEDFTSKDSKSGEMSVMESEKLGVTILGRRFGDHIQQVPIKKRRFLQLQPTSSPSSLCFPEQIHCLSSCKNGKMQDLNEKKSFQGLNLHNTRIDGDLYRTIARTSNLREEHGESGEGADLYRTMAHTSNLREEHGESGEGADFSGISILAAAACGGGLADNDVMISIEQEHEVSKSNIQKDEPNSMSEDKFNVQSLDATGCAAVLSASEVATSELSNDGDRTKIGEPDVIEQHLNDCSKMLVGSCDTLSRSPLREEKFCWDLNKAIDDAWEDSELDFVESQDPSAYGSIKNDVHAAESGKQGAFQGCIGDVQCPSKLHKDTYLDGKLKDGEMCNVADGSANQLLSRDCNNAIDRGSESQGLSVCADDSSQSNCRFADDAFKVVGEREVSSNADDSLASGVISPDDFMVSPVADTEGLHVGKVSSLHVAEWHQKAGFPINSLIGARASGILVDSSNSEKVFCSSDGCVVDGQSETVSKTTTLCVSETIIESSHKPESALVSQDTNIQESGGSTDLNVQVESFTELKDNPVQCSAVDINPNTVIDCLQNESKDSVIESGSAVWAGTKEGLEAVDATVNTSEEYAPERHAGWCWTSFHNDREQQIKLEKVEIQEDDDSQYEDGEFRVSHDLGIDGCDEEAEHVDYGSDDKDTIAAESSPDHFSSNGAPHLDAVGLTSQKPLVKKDSRVDDGSQVPKCLIETGLRHFRNSNVETGGKRTGVLDRVRRTCSSRDGAKELSRPTFLKLKSSGWDQLPERSRQNKNAAGDDRSAGSKNTRTGSPDGYFSIEGSRVGGLKQRMDPSSRLDRFNCSEISRKEDAGYFWRKREYPDDPDHTFERNEGRATAIRKDESSACMREKGGSIGECRDASWYKSQHKFSPGHYSSLSKLKNAAASSLKGVSNGFVASHDETVVGPPDFEFNNRAIRRNITASVQDAQHPPKERRSATRRDEELNFDRSTDIGLVRDTSPTSRGNTSCGRPGRYEPRIITTGHGHGYLGPISGDDIDSMLPTQHSFSRNDRKFSPRRGSVHIPKAQTRSRSRSRTRSPHPWRSPRRKNDIEMNGSRRWSRSPNFRTGRGERTRISLQRPGFFDEMTDFAPSRNRASPPLPSRWIDERKDLRCHSREHEYRCSAGRSPSERFFSHDRKIFVENERLKTEEYRQSSNAGRFREFAVDKRPRLDGLTVRRGYDNRYRRFTSPSGQHDIVGNDKHPSYDDHASFRPRISRHGVGQEFDDRGSPRDLNGDPEKQMGGLPCRPRNDGSHHFRYSRDVRQDRSFRSFEIRECDDDMTIRRRPP